MKYSQYNVIFETQNKYYIYNTLSTAIAEINENVYNLINTNNLKNLDEKYYQIMFDQHFIVDSNSNEVEEYLYFYDYIRFTKTAKVLSVTFIPTYNCNLKCSYCMQGNVKDNKSIVPEDIDKILLFVESQIISSQKIGIPITKLHVGLYGGEPLTQKESIKIFIEKMFDYSKKYNCEIKYSMTSNMTLLDDDVLSLIKRYKISTQISIDGCQKNHDVRRTKLDGSGTYSIIVNNLKKLVSNGLKEYIVIRINIDKENLLEAEDILKEIRDYSNDIYFGFLDTFSGLNDSFSNQCISSEIYPQIISKKLDEISKKYKFIIPARFGKQSPCAMNCINKYFIDLYLNVYKCEMFINKPEVSVGRISSDGRFIPNAGFYHQINRSPKSFSECMSCLLLPMCAGGCAGKSYINGETKNVILNEKYCMYDKNALLEYLKEYVINHTII